MAEYIEKHQFLEDFKNNAPLTYLLIFDAVKSYPTMDIVRCKDCKHKPTGSGVNHDIRFPDQDYKCPCRCEDFYYSWMPDDDWFCANGERGEE